MSNNINQQIVGKFAIAILAFADGEGGDVVCDRAQLGEVTAPEGGYVEVGMDYGEERVYIRFRMRDLARAVTELKA